MVDNGERQGRTDAATLDATRRQRRRRGRSAPRTSSASSSHFSLTKSSFQQDLYSALYCSTEQRERATEELSQPYSAQLRPAPPRPASASASASCFASAACPPVVQLAVSPLVCCAVSNSDGAILCCGTRHVCSPLLPSRRRRPAASTCACTARALSLAAPVRARRSERLSFHLSVLLLRRLPALRPCCVLPERFSPSVSRECGGGHRSSARCH